jgi:hypothetical protein
MSGQFHRPVFYSWSKLRQFSRHESGADVVRKRNISALETPTQPDDGDCKYLWNVFK